MKRGEGRFSDSGLGMEERKEEKHERGKRKEDRKVPKVSESQK